MTTIETLESRTLFAAPVVPIFNSNATAKVKLFLDFNGDTTSSWGTYSPGTTPSYDMDGNPSSFNQAELTNIDLICRGVAEKFSPFNINVTTVDPGTYGNLSVARAVIGGTGSWYGATIGGISFTGGFYTSSSNTAFIFSSNFGNDPLTIAGATSHEVGHLFGLSHQSLWSNNTLINEYNTGNSLFSPIMGISWGPPRIIWYNGPTKAGPNALQDDMAIIASSTNGFGYKSDDYSETFSSAPLITSTAKGVIEKTLDADTFKYTSPAGTNNISITIKPIDFAGMLDASLIVYDTNGNIIQTANSASLQETIQFTSNGGSYYIKALGSGEYGSVGQYTISVSVVDPPASVPSAPVLTLAQYVFPNVVLNWADTSSNEFGFVVQRSSDNGSTWVDLANIGQNVTNFTDSNVAIGSYIYRVYSYNGLGNSDYSNQVIVISDGVSQVPLAPTNLVATGSHLSWIDNSTNETLYIVQYSPNNGVNWFDEVHLPTNSISYDLTPKSGIYSYRVQAINGNFVSDASNVVVIDWGAAPPPPPPPDIVINAPTQLTTTKGSGNNWSLSWKDNSDNEAFFLIQYSSDGVNWITDSTLLNNVTSADLVRRKGTLFYRVVAINGASRSTSSNVVTVNWPGKN